MSGALRLLEQLSKAGVRVEADADRIRFAPKSAVSDEMVSRLRRHKDEIITIVTASDRATADNSPPRKHVADADDFVGVDDFCVDGNTFKPEEVDNTVDTTEAHLNKTGDGWYRLAWCRPHPSGLWDDYRYLTDADLEYLTAPPDGAIRCVWCGRRSGHVSPTAYHPGCVTLSDEWAVKLPCGQFKGRPVRDVDRDYLRWLRRNMTNLPSEVITEIDRLLADQRMES